MKTTQIAHRNSILAALASVTALTGCTTYVVHQAPPAPPPAAYTEPAPPPAPPAPPAPTEPPATVEVVIHDERDFYEPLTPYGHWEFVGDYGRCWVPARVDSNWRPYTNGHWERTDAGWYWVSDEPWGWATYHYGRWDYDAHFGWFWVPQTMWAPAWVTWNRGGGYVGWAPLPPSVRAPRSGLIEVNPRAIPHHGYVFVEERHFLEPIRPTTVVNNTTIINKTVNITNVKVVNNTVINEGPRAQDIEHVSGHKVTQVPARQLRHKIEAPIAAAHQPRVNEPSLSQVPAQPKPPVTAVTTSTPAPARLDPDRLAAERARQEKLEADRKAQADADRARQAALAKAKQDFEQQQRKAAAEAARIKQETDARAREQAARDARQKQAEEARRKQELDRQAQTQAAKNPVEQARQPQARPQSQQHTNHGVQPKQAHQPPHQQDAGKKPAEPQSPHASTNGPNAP